MNILFIHNNFPGQFLKLAPYLASQISGRTIFLTRSENSQKIRLDGVEVVHFTTHRNQSTNVHNYLKPVEQCVLQGQAVVKALDQLLRQGFRPNIIISHAGVGSGIYIKSFLSSVRLISYVEWFFKPETSRYIFADFQLNDNLAMQTMMWPLMHEMLCADDLVCPTQWQRSQFPSPWYERIQVIFDGVDTELFQPRHWRGVLSLTSGSSGHTVILQSSDRVLTYATRGMEPLRGFPQFMRAAAVAQQANSDVQVVIAGNDRVVYSHHSAHPSGSWKQQMLKELSDQLDLKRLHFVGLLPYRDLAKLMQRSNLYCYFTRPYVVSWSLFEAAACGTRLLINQFEGIDEVLALPSLLPPVNLDDQEEINQAVLRGITLERPHFVQDSLLLPEMDFHHTKHAWLKLLAC
ncbi:glycosyltransferase [Synechococcus sp. M16CYN]|uniref:glycosyltransferase n=1 Tax=Synechococcus sp. M16CYN TaxID=3103139 RepID=UPI003248660F